MRNERFHQLLDEIKHLHDLKNTDYATEEDPLANLKDCSRLGIHPATGAICRMQDKMRRIEAFFKKGELVNESVRDSLVDLAIYSLLSVLLLDEDTPQPKMPDQHGSLKPVSVGVIEAVKDDMGWSEASEEMVAKPIVSKLAKLK